MTLVKQDRWENINREKKSLNHHVWYHPHLFSYFTGNSCSTELTCLNRQHYAVSQSVKTSRGKVESEDHSTEISTSLLACSYRAKWQISSMLYFISLSRRTDVHDHLLQNHKVSQEPYKCWCLAEISLVLTLSTVPASHRRQSSIPVFPVELL